MQSIECLLTQAQVKRYLAGAEFSDDLLLSIERHLKACPDCMAEASRQREALGGGAGETLAAVEPVAKTSLIAKVKTAFAPRVVEEPLLANPGQSGQPDPIAVLKTPKNLILSGSLAVVLVAMSLMMRNPSSLFGPRVMKPGTKTVAIAEKDALKTAVSEGSHAEHPAEWPSTSGTEDSGHPDSGSESDGKASGHEEAAPGAKPVADEHGVKATGEHDTKATDELSSKEAPEHAPKPADQHSEKGEDHGKESEPVSHSTSTHTDTEPAKLPVEGHKPAATKQDKVGGRMLIAEAGHPDTKAVVAKHVAPKKPTQRRKTASRPKSKVSSRPKRPLVRKATSGVRIYLPDGTPKH